MGSRRPIPHRWVCARGRGAQPKPAIDLYVEFLVIHNTEMVRIGSRSGDSKPPGPRLIDACRRYRIVGMDKAHKEDMRHLAYSKENHTSEEIAQLKEYCLEDGYMTKRLYCAMLPHLDLLRAPLRAAFMMEIERIRWAGIPIDMPTYRRFKQHAPAIGSKLRAELNRKLGIEIYYCDVFKKSAVFRLMMRHKIPIPIDPKTGKFSAALKHLKNMIEAQPVLKVFYRDKKLIDALRDLKLEIGDDGRNRVWLNPFATKTGRNNPSTNRLVLGLPFTMRSLIAPELGTAIGQVDFGNEEVGIAGFLSKDQRLIKDYLSGDPYRQFAADALGITDPTKEQRQVYKACVLGRIYGLGVKSLARNLGISRAQAQSIMIQMGARYPVLNAWLERITTKAAHCAPIVCVHGWNLTMTGKSGEERTFLNFPMQANASELMRLVIVRAGAAGLKIIGCAHDSFLIEDTIENIEQSVALLQQIMRQASRDLLGGYELRADCDPEIDIVCYPDRFVEKRERESGMANWNRLMALIEEQENAQSRRSGDHRHGDTISASEKEESKKCHHKRQACPIHRDLRQDSA